MVRKLESIFAYQAPLYARTHAYIVHTEKPTLHRFSTRRERASRIAFMEGFAKTGERVIVVAGAPLDTPGATNRLRIAFVGGDADVGD